MPQKMDTVEGEMVDGGRWQERYGIEGKMAVQQMWCRQVMWWYSGGSCTAAHEL